MPIDVKTPDDLHKLIGADIDKLADITLWVVMDYAESFIVNEYTKTCMTFWPLMAGDKEINDPVSGEKFSKSDSPKNVVEHIRVDFNTINEHTKSGTIRVDVAGKPELEKLERAARIQEMIGCRPWGRLKTHLNENFNDIIKQRINTIKNRFGS